MSRFLDALRSGRVLLMDGAMGTELQRAGLEAGECGELWNLKRPDKVLGVHQSYRQAGALVLLTNTFQAVHASIGGRVQRSHASSTFLYDERATLLALQWAAYALARAACGREGFVLADVGSFSSSDPREEFSDYNLMTAAAAHLGDVDGVLLETCSTERVRSAVRRIRKICPDAPLLLSMTYRRRGDGDLETLSGHAPEWFAGRAAGWGVDALGVNCGRDLGMEDVTEIIRRYRNETDLPLFGRPNAGTPVRTGDQWAYPHTPEAMAARLPELLKAGVSMVGGCCGTTPAHIAAFRPVIDRWNEEGAA